MSRDVLDEGYRHFELSGEAFEYGRSDKRFSVHGQLTDSSRAERDGDGDGRRGVDCSSLVWRSLREAGYNVPQAPFSTHYLFAGDSVEPSARKNFDVLPASEAKAPHGALEVGDIILFKEKHGTGQHVAIFSGYDDKGNITFYGSQVSTGPALVSGNSVAPGAYWNGGAFEIVGALRPKEEFRVRPATHAAEGPVTLDFKASRDTSAHPQVAGSAVPSGLTPAAPAAHQNVASAHRESEVQRDQAALNALGYRGADGKPLETRSGIAGPQTEHAVREFQKAHGLDVNGKLGPETREALSLAARHPLVSEAGHPNNALYKAVAGHLPNGTDPNAIANVTLQVMENGIDRPEKLGNVAVKDGNVFIQGTVPGERVRVDLTAPTADMTAMSNHMAAQTQQQVAQPQPQPAHARGM